MLYNSFVFIFLFLPLVITSFMLVFHFLGGKASQIVLIVASLFFYGYWEASYLLIIITSIITNFIFAKMIIYKKQNNENTKVTLFIAILSNVLLLGYFKYTDFLITNINSILTTEFNLLELALPLAISFFTIQQIAFLVDSHFGIVKELKFIDYALFVLFFPQLIAGPIVRYRESFKFYLASNLRQISPSNLLLGLSIFGFGLFKKVFIADSFSEISDFGYQAMLNSSYIDTLIFTSSYTLQMYFDFSGYSDMAFGLAIIFGVKIPFNFLSPYRANNVIDFWKKWHISLTSFITNYIYNPILFSIRKMDLGTTTLVSMFAFTVSGIWHGANWNFILWGLMHGTAISINHIWRKYGFRINKYFSWLITIYFINLTFVVFKNIEFSSMLMTIKKLFFFNNDYFIPIIDYERMSFANEILSISATIFGKFLIIIFLYILASIFILFNLNTQTILNKFKLNFSQSFVYILLLLVAIFSISKQVEFLYFVF